jgi:hypothetical protein
LINTKADPVEGERRWAAEVAESEEKSHAGSSDRIIL